MKIYDTIFISISYCTLLIFHVASLSSKNCFNAPAKRCIQIPDYLYSHLPSSVVLHTICVMEHRHVKKCPLHLSLVSNYPSAVQCIWHHSSYREILTNFFENSLFMCPQSIKLLPTNFTIIFM